MLDPFARMPAASNRVDELHRRPASRVRGTRMHHRCLARRADHPVPHFVLGSNMRQAPSVRPPAATAAGATASGDLIFEDRQPRLADLDGDGPMRSSSCAAIWTACAALAVAGDQGRQLQLVAETASDRLSRIPGSVRPASPISTATALDIAYVRCLHCLAECAS